jgi:hypothetical protein
MKVNNKLIGMFTGAAMAIAAAVSPAFSADGQPSYKDLRQENAERIKISGSAASGNDRIALLVRGGDDALLGAIWGAASMIEKNTGRDVWFLHAPGTPQDGADASVDVYVSGAYTGVLKLSGDTSVNASVSDKLYAAVEDGIDMIDKRASLNPDHALNYPSPH